MTVDRAAGAPKMSKRDTATRERNLSRLQARVNVETARADFVGTLNALEDKLNVPKQARKATDRATKRIRAFASDQPVAAAAVAVGVLAAAGAVVWLVIRNATKS